jgi:hypothetical protein
MHGRDGRGVAGADENRVDIIVGCAADCAGMSLPPPHAANAVVMVRVSPMLFTCWVMMLCLLDGWSMGWRWFADDLFDCARLCMKRLLGCLALHLTGCRRQNCQRRYFHSTHWRTKPVFPMRDFLGLSDSCLPDI